MITNHILSGISHYLGKKFHKPSHIVQNILQHPKIFLEKTKTLFPKKEKKFTILKTQYEKKFSEVFLNPISQSPHSSIHQSTLNDFEIFFQDIDPEHHQNIDELMFFSEMKEQLFSILLQLESQNNTSHSPQIPPPLISSAPFIQYYSDMLLNGIIAESHGNIFRHQPGFLSTRRYEGLIHFFQILQSSLQSITFDHQEIFGINPHHAPLLLILLAIEYISHVTAHIDHNQQIYKKNLLSHIQFYGDNTFFETVIAPNYSLFSENIDAIIDHTHCDVISSHQKKIPSLFYHMRMLIHGYRLHIPHSFMEKKKFHSHHSHHLKKFFREQGFFEKIFGKQFSDLCHNANPHIHSLWEKK